MSRLADVSIDTGIILILILGIGLFRTPRRARAGNLIAAFALFGALVAVLYRNRISGLPIVVGAAAASALVSWLVAMRANMIRIPAMVAFQNGAGGAASFLVSYVHLTRTAGDPLTPVGQVVGILGLVAGATTFSGSMIAGGKLANLLRQAPTAFRHHGAVLLGLAAGTVALGVVAGIARGGQGAWYPLVGLSLLSVALGVVFSLRIGGADMPVLISFLNATTGLAVAFCGIVVRNRLLIVCGATVAASGSILTHAMCRAMNRNLAQVFRGIRAGVLAGSVPTSPGPQPLPAGGPPSSAAAEQPTGPGGTDRGDPLSEALNAARKAASVIVIPGYGMALAHAAEEVVQLARTLAEMNKHVRFAIHPVAGRMPGHMHVLLAEAEVDYETLFDLDDINSEFGETDLVVVVGACDVVNPAALHREGTPISGMPVLRADEAKRVVVCNLDAKPGYSGVPNPLYESPKAVLLFGDAKTTVTRLLRGLARDP